MESTDKTLVILAAGMGSRFGGLKQVQPIDKQLNHNCLNLYYCS